MHSLGHSCAYTETHGAVCHCDNAKSCASRSKRQVKKRSTAVQVKKRSTAVQTEETGKSEKYASSFTSNSLLTVQFDDLG